MSESNCYWKEVDFFNVFSHFNKEPQFHMFSPHPLRVVPPMTPPTCCCHVCVFSKCDFTISRCFQVASWNPTLWPFTFLFCQPNRLLFIRNVYISTAAARAPPEVTPASSLLFPPARLCWYLDVHRCVITLLLGFVQAAQVFLEWDQLLLQLRLNVWQCYARKCTTTSPICQFEL